MNKSSLAVFNKKYIYYQYLYTLGSSYGHHLMLGKNICLSSEVKSSNNNSELCLFISKIMGLLLAVLLSIIIESRAYAVNYTTTQICSNGQTCIYSAADTFNPSSKSAIYVIGSQLKLTGSQLFFTDSIGVILDHSTGEITDATINGATDSTSGVNVSVRNSSLLTLLGTNRLTGSRRGLNAQGNSHVISNGNLDIDINDPFSLNPEISGITSFEASIIELNGLQTNISLGNSRINKAKYGLFVDSGGVITTDNVQSLVTVTTYGTGGEAAIMATGLNSRINLVNANIKTLGLSDSLSSVSAYNSGSVTFSGLLNIESPFSKGVEVSSGGIVLLNDVNITNSGNQDHSIYAEGDLSKVAITGSANLWIGYGSVAVDGVHADNSSRIDLNGTTVINNKGSISSSGVIATHSAIIDITGSTLITIAGDDSFGLAVYDGASLLARNTDLVINTTGSGASAILASGEDTVLSVNGGTINTTGANAHGISVTNRASKTLDKNINNILPHVTISGSGSAVLNASGTASHLTLLNTSLNTAMTAGLDSWGAKAENEGLITLGTNTDTGGTRLWAIGGIISLNDNANAAGSQVRLNTLGVLDISAFNGNATVGSIDGDGSIALGSNTLIIGANNIGNNGSLVDNADYAGAFSGSGNLIKTGNLNQILSGAGHMVSDIFVNEGTLTFKQNGTFTATGNFTTAGGATTVIGAQPAILQVGGAFKQLANSNLVAWIGASPDIIANSATLEGKLTINGFNAIPEPILASAVTNQNYNFIHTTNGITGNFTNINSIDGSFINSGLDYLITSGFVENSGLDYNLGFEMAWTETNPSKRRGSFSLAEGSAFNVDLVLANQPASNTWSGQALIKSGSGLLVLSAKNTYTGSTTITGGELALKGAGNISTSSNLSLTSIYSLFDVSNIYGTDTTVNNLSGVPGSQLVLGGKTLTVNNSQDTGYDGDIDVSAASLVKVGNSTLTLSGNTAYTGHTLIKQGQLVLDGIKGGGQLVSDITGLQNTQLSLVRGASLTGIIDPIDVSIDSHSHWNMTGDSIVNKMMLAGNIYFSPVSHLTQGRTLEAANWEGQNGVVELFATLNNGQSISDKLIINGGNVTGQTYIAVHNAGGLGGQTTGNGILVVEGINGANTTVQSSKDSFKLIAPVYAGVYSYKLTAGDAQQRGENWYLTSTYSYRPETALLPSSIDLVGQIWQSMVSTLNDRRGDAYRGNDTEIGEDQAIWMRFIGQDNQRNSNEGGSTPEFQAHISGLELGTDLWNRKTDDDADNIVGVYTSMAHGNADVKGFIDGGVNIDAGSVSSDAYSIAGYFTRTESNGLYTDTVLQYGWSVGNRANRINVNGQGITASLEIGFPFSANKTFFIEPQIQVIYQNMQFDDIELAETSVSSIISDQTTGRIGLRGVWHDVTLGTVQWTPYLKVNAWGQTGGNIQTAYMTETHETTLQNNFNHTTLELGGGTSLELSRTVSAYVQASYRDGISHGGHTTQGSLGLNWRF
ncbi:putative autotransporter protein [Yersinia aldovae]|uniref:autotransporter outer membrane beta-barrel domain-containing protein n=1 Tax=Yersinia aldovae TaxID=29483 RepID=UPI0005DF2BB1|nr:autotransporter outer membrane beta-barrel domain-containing protein [Yersinia aldovae]CNI26079.1 putative autotransporter protein [Yersinia aldovae]